MRAPPRSGPLALLSMLAAIALLAIFGAGCGPHPYPNDLVNDDVVVIQLGVLPGQRDVHGNVGLYRINDAVSTCWLVVGDGTALFCEPSR